MDAKLLVLGGPGMDVSNTCVVNGSLQISTEVIAKIARMAALEIEEGGSTILCEITETKSLG